MTKIKDIRTEIDKIDDQMIVLLRQRKALIAEIKKAKQKENAPKIDIARENEIFAKLEDEYEKSVFRQIIEESKKLQ